MSAGGELWFYHLERRGVDEALAPLLEKCLQRGWRALVRVGGAERAAALDEALWTYRDDSFLPHGRADGPRPERQPVLITARTENLNAAAALFALDGTDPFAAGPFARACVMFDGRDPAARAAARAHWTAAKGHGLAPVYWQDGSNGWEKKA